MWGVREPSTPTPTLAPGPPPALSPGQLLRKSTGQGSGMEELQPCWPWGVFLPGHQGEEPQLELECQ